jgi:hypothetical protein
VLQILKCVEKNGLKIIFAICEFNRAFLLLFAMKIIVSKALFFPRATLCSSQEKYKKKLADIFKKKDDDGWTLKTSWRLHGASSKNSQ